MVEMGWKSEVDIDLYNGIYVIQKVWPMISQGRSFLQTTRGNADMG